jgi:adenine-specific DNA-methyltransferase
MKPTHQIWLGKSEELAGRFKDGRINCVITDPPFGVDNQSNMAKTVEGKAHARKIANDESPEVAIATFQRVMAALIPKMAMKSDMYVFTSYQVLLPWHVMLDAYLPRYGFKQKAILVWKKDGPGMGDTNTPWGMGCEFIFFFQRGPRDKSAERRNNVLNFSQLRPTELIHPHEKPLPLLETLIKQSTVRGDFLVDPFGGSGSLVRAAQRCGRNAVAMEMDEHNWKLATRKLEEGDGEGFQFN